MTCCKRCDGEACNYWRGRDRGCKMPDADEMWIQNSGICTSLVNIHCPKMVWRRRILWCRRAARTSSGE